MTENIEENEPKVGKGKTALVIVGAILVALAIIAGATALLLPYFVPKKTAMQAIENTRNAVAQSSSITNTVIAPIVKNVGTDKFSLEQEIDIEKGGALGGYGLGIKSNIDRESKKAQTELSLLKNSGNIANAQLYTDDSNAMAVLKGLSDKVFTIGCDNVVSGLKNSNLEIDKKLLENKDDFSIKVLQNNDIKKYFEDFTAKTLENADVTLGKGGKVDLNGNEIKCDTYNFEFPIDKLNTDFSAMIDGIFDDESVKNYITILYDTQFGNRADEIKESIKNTKFESAEATIFVKDNLVLKANIKIKAEHEEAKIVTITLNGSDNPQDTVKIAVASEDGTALGTMESGGYVDGEAVGQLLNITDGFGNKYVLAAEYKKDTNDLSMSLNLAGSKLDCRGKMNTSENSMEVSFDTAEISGTEIFDGKGSYYLKYGTMENEITEPQGERLDLFTASKEDIENAKKEIADKIKTIIISMMFS